MLAIRKLLPSHLHQILDYISPTAWKVVPWKELIPISRKLTGSQRLDKDAIIESLSSHPSAAHLPRVVKTTADGFDVRSLSYTQKRTLGECLLALYFSQLANPEGLFADLRPKNFAFNPDQAPAVDWHPSLPIAFDPEFRLALVKLYLSFYQGQDLEFKAALLSLGLLKTNWPESTQNELIGLLKRHFGSSASEPICFSIEDFKASFHALFQFFRDQKVRIPPDFLLLGVYLSTLYLSLDSLQTALDVRTVALEQLEDHA